MCREGQDFMAPTTPAMPPATAPSTALRDRHKTADRPRMNTQVTSLLKYTLDLDLDFMSIH